MEQIKKTDSNTVIPKSLFAVCALDNLTLKEICALYSAEDVGMKSGCHQLAKFSHHIKKSHGMDLKTYCEKYLGIAWRNCPVKNVPVGYKFITEGIKLSRFSLGGLSKSECPAFAKACERFSVERTGSGNPMFGRKAWNAGLDISDERIKRMADLRRGTKTSEETRKKQSEIRKKHPLKARHTTKHAPETIDKLRKNTARLWASGHFNRISSIHVKVREFLKTLPLLSEFIEEYQIKYFSMDMAFPTHKIAIECQGTYYHIDPRFYPNGPKDAIQRRNFGRDIAKRKVCCDQEGWKIIALWETEINNGHFKNELICKLKEYGLLK